MAISIKFSGNLNRKSRPYFRHTRVISMTQRMIWQIRQNHVSNFEHGNMFTNLCALHAQYPACRSTISVSLDCLKDRFEVYSVTWNRRDSSGFSWRQTANSHNLRTSSLNTYNLPCKLLDAESSNNKFRHVRVIASFSQLNRYLEKEYITSILFHLNFLP